MKRNMCIIAMLLWLLTLMAGSWLLVAGWTTPGSDG